MSVFGIAVVLAVWFFWRKHRRAMKAQRAWPDDASRGGPGGSRSYPTDKVAEVPTYERPGEMSANEPPAEIMTTAPSTEVFAHPGPVELPAEHVRQDDQFGVSGKELHR